MPHQKRMQELEKENQVLKKRMEELLFILAGIAHDFNQPLQAIMGYAELLSQHPRVDQVDNLNTLKRAARFLERLARNFLNFTKPYATENSQLNFSTFNIVDLVKENSELMHGVASKKKVKISLDEVIGIPPVRADSFLLSRLVINLLSNAIKFTPENGEIRISIQPRNGESVVVKIKDTGCGIPYKELKSIFLKRAQGSNNKTEVGHGLGLAVCKQIVNLHGSRIWAKSKGLNKGASFYFTLPVAKPFSSG
jgi:signal transduction histidine kinase